MKQKRLKYVILVILITLVAAILCRYFGTVSSVYASESESFFRVKISEKILTKPYSVTAWRLYGQLKLEWREELFFQRFPDEKKYRYTYKEELDCRRKLAEYWMQFKQTNPGVSDPYLDNLVIIFKSIYLPEYVYKYYKTSSWDIKKNRFRLKEYKKWAKKHIKGHKSETYAKLEKIKLGN